MIETHDKCKDCKWYDGAGSSLGRCRKRCPIAHEDKGAAVWPKVYASNWCGDFEVIPYTDPIGVRIDGVPEFKEEPRTYTDQREGWGPREAE